MRNNRMCARASSAMVMVLGSLAVVAALVVALYLQRPHPAIPGGTAPLLVYCAAGLKPPVERAAREFEAKYGVPVQLQFGGSGTLLGSIRTVNRGDLFLAADWGHILLAQKYGVAAEVVPLVKQTPVIAVAAGNPKHIVGVADLLRPDVRLSLANPEAAAIGTVGRSVLTRDGQWTAVEARVRANGVFKPTVNDVANDIKLGAADAGIVWDATVRQYPKLQAVRAAEFDKAAETVAVTVLKSSNQPAEAWRFIRFLVAPDQGGAAFTAAGYELIKNEPKTPTSALATKESPQ